MALPAFRAAGALIHGINGVTPAAPAGLATDDVELLLVETMDEAVTLTTANGFVEVAGSPISVPNATATIATRLTVYWRRWDGAAGDPVIADSGNHNVAQRIAFSGCITTGNPWDITVASSEATEDTSGSATGGTTTVVDCLAVLCLASAKPDTLSTAEISAPANADLATVTERVDNAGNSGNGGHLGMITGEKAAAGAFGATTYTKATSAYKAHLVVALKPLAGGTTHFGAADLAITVGIDSVGQKTRFGVSDFPITFQVDSDGGELFFGVADLAVTAQIDSAGAVFKSGAADFPITLGVDSAGTVFKSGAADLAITAQIDSAGQKTRFGAADSPITLGIDSVGQKTRFGAADLPILVGIDSAGRVVTTHLGVADLPITLGIESSGKRRRLWLTVMEEDTPTLIVT